jgi:hypothetical protein
VQGAAGSQSSRRISSINHASSLTHHAPQAIASTWGAAHKQQVAAALARLQKESRDRQQQPAAGSKAPQGAAPQPRRRNSEPDAAAVFAAAAAAGSEDDQRSDKKKAMKPQPPPGSKLQVIPRCSLFVTRLLTRSTPGQSQRERARRPCSAPRCRRRLAQQRQCR